MKVKVVCFTAAINTFQKVQLLPQRQIVSVSSLCHIFFKICYSYETQRQVNGGQGVFHAICG